MSFTIAIDGPAAAGKGTISRAISAHFDLAHLDTGLLYRVIGAKMLEGEAPLDAAEALTAIDLERPDLRTHEVAQAASKVAVLPEVRAALTNFQRAFAQRAGGAVLDGRDIGTVICPQAAVKLFVTASVEVRAKRRFLELAQKGTVITLDEVLTDVRQRDERDMNRAEAPLKPAEDAVIVDTSVLTIDDAIQHAITVVDSKRQPTGQCT